MIFVFLPVFFFMVKMYCASTTPPTRAHTLALATAPTLATAARSMAAHRPQPARRARSTAPNPRGALRAGGTTSANGGARGDGVPQGGEPECGRESCEKGENPPGAEEAPKERRRTSSFPAYHHPHPPRVEVGEPGAPATLPAVPNYVSQHSRAARCHGDGARGAGGGGEGAGALPASASRGPPLPVAGGPSARCGSAAGLVSSQRFSTPLIPP